MNMIRKLGLVSVVALAGLAAACAHAPAPAETAAAPAAAAPAPVASADPRVKFKDGERYLRDLSAALGIPRDTICKELGQYDCVSDAFRIVLGGVEAPNMLVNVPLEEAALTAPIALDRVALHVCLERVNMDAADPEHAVLMRAGAFGPKGKARKVDPKWMTSTAAGIYDVLLQRPASPEETQRLVGFYGDVRADRPAASKDAVSDWVKLSCFAVASSLESVFY